MDAEVHEEDTQSAEVWSHVRSVQQGRTAAFEHVYRAYADSVRSYLYSLTHDHLVAQDLTSETFLRALKSIRRVEDHGKPLRAWLMTIARNLALDHLASWTTRNVFSVERDFFFARPGPARDVEETVIRRETVRLVRRNLEILPQPQRECLSWRFLAGLSVADTARRMQRSDIAVRAMQYRAVRKLGRLMNEGGDERCRAA